MSDFFNTGLSQQQFLDEYWQQKPLLIRQAFPSFQTPVTADELAGLACEEDIESRLIEEFGETPWQVRSGPFDDTVFTALPTSNWTLLVQDVDKHIADLNYLLEPFRFIPDWRRDDIMISYAVDQGSVGPHTDGYDVFLLQADGVRRWQISDSPVIEAELIDGIDIKVLQEFNVDHTWDLEPGDILYLPPHFAHHGVAQGECMTFSIGFRAPTQTELLDAAVNSLMENERGTERYTDVKWQVESSRSEISEQAISTLKQQLHQAIDNNDDLLANVFGRLVTETKPSLAQLAEEMMDDRPELIEIQQRFEQGDVLARNQYYRLAWSQNIQKTELYVAGEAFDVETVKAELLVKLCENRQLTHQDWLALSQHASLAELLQTLIEDGVWYWSAT
jgi:50S ribosomal protein L16 3-hydroxylase